MEWLWPRASKSDAKKSTRRARGAQLRVHSCPAHAERNFLPAGGVARNLKTARTTGNVGATFQAFLPAKPLPVYRLRLELLPLSGCRHTLDHTVASGLLGCSRLGIPVRSETDASPTGCAAGRPGRALRRTHPSTAPRQTLLG